MTSISNELRKAVLQAAIPLDKGGIADALSWEDALDMDTGRHIDMFVADGFYQGLHIVEGLLATVVDFEDDFSHLTPAEDTVVVVVDETSIADFHGSPVPVVGREFGNRLLSHEVVVIFRSVEVVEAIVATVGGIEAAIVILGPLRHLLLGLPLLHLLIAVMHLLPVFLVFCCKVQNIIHHK